MKILVVIKASEVEAALRELAMGVIDAETIENIGAVQIKQDGTATVEFQTLG